MSYDPSTAFRPEGFSGEESGTTLPSLGEFRKHNAGSVIAQPWPFGELLALEPGRTINHPTFSGSFPVDDTTTLVRDPADNTKLLRIDVGAVATATTRVLTMPDADVDLAANSKAKFSTTSDASVQNTTTETDFAPTGTGSSTIAANSMAVGQVYKIVVRGVLSTA